MNSRRTYREAAVWGANPVALVVLLYEQIVEDLRKVAKAIENHDIGLRTDRIKHAILVIGHLQSSLDFAHGGKVAKDLDTFYNFLRGNLVQVQIHPTNRGVTQLITDLLALREAWVTVERAESLSASAGQAPAGVFPAGGNNNNNNGDDGDSNRGRMKWQG